MLLNGRQVKSKQEKGRTVKLAGFHPVWTEAIHETTVKMVSCALGCPLADLELLQLRLYSLSRIAPSLPHECFFQPSLYVIPSASYSTKGYWDLGRFIQPLAAPDRPGISVS